MRFHMRLVERIHVRVEHAVVLQCLHSVNGDAVLDLLSKLKQVSLQCFKVFSDFVDLGFKGMDYSLAIGGERCFTGLYDSRIDISCGSCWPRDATHLE